MNSTETALLVVLIILTFMLVSSKNGPLSKLWNRGASSGSCCAAEKQSAPASEESQEVAQPESKPSAS